MSGEEAAEKAATAYRCVAESLLPGERGGSVVLKRDDLADALTKAYRDGFETGALYIAANNGHDEVTA